MSVKFSHTSGDFPYENEGFPYRQRVSKYSLISSYNNVRENVQEIIIMVSYVSNDNSGQHLVFERRHFFYAGHIPERRSDKDRRSSLGKR